MKTNAGRRAEIIANKVRNHDWARFVREYLKNGKAGDRNNLYDKKGNQECTAKDDKIIDDGKGWNRNLTNDVTKNNTIYRKQVELSRAKLSSLSWVEAELKFDLVWWLKYLESWSNL